MKERTLICMLVLLPFFVVAADAVREPMQEKDLPGYDQVRDPFWPTNYVRKIEVKVDPTLPVPPPEVKQFVPKWPKLKLKAITSSPNGFIAIIENVTGLVVDGQIIRMVSDGVEYSWRIDNISLKGFSQTQLEAKPTK